MMIEVLLIFDLDRVDLLKWMNSLDAKRKNSGPFI